LVLHGDAVLCGRFGDRVDDALARQAACTHSEDERSALAGADDDVRRSGRAVDEVPRLQLPHLVLDDQHALACEDEEILLRVLGVVSPEALPRLEHADVDPELREAVLALVDAVDPERILVPAGLTRVDDEPALALRHETGFRLLEAGLGNHSPRRLTKMERSLPVADRPRRPEWMKVRAPSAGTRYFEVRELIHGQGLHTICEEARCPNIAECWGRGTATFQILGDTCTRACRYCYVHSGKPD